MILYLLGTNLIRIWTLFKYLKEFCKLLFNAEICGLECMYLIKYNKLRIKL